MTIAWFSRTRLTPLFCILVCLLMTACSAPLRNENALFSAAVSGDTLQVQRLLKSGVDPDITRKNGITALFLAAQHQRPLLVKQLLDAGATIDASGYRGITPLIVAATAGHSDIVELLLARGANPNWRRNDGATALYMAAQEGHLDVLRQLLAAKADVNLPAYQKATALFIAAQSGRGDIVAALLEKGATVEKGLPDGTTPLLVAVKKGHAGIVRQLLQSGADPHNRSSRGENAVEIARSNNDAAMLKLLGEPGTGPAMSAAESAVTAGRGELQPAATGSAIKDRANGASNAVDRDAEKNQRAVLQADIKSTAQLKKPSKPGLETTQSIAPRPDRAGTAANTRASVPKLQAAKKTVAKKAAVKAKTAKPASNNASVIKTNKARVADPGADDFDDPEFNNDPSSFGWSASKFVQSVDAVTAPVVGSARPAPAIGKRNPQSALSGTAKKSKALTNDSAYLASLDSEADTAALGNDVSKPVNRSVDTLLASGIEHYFRGEFKQAASEFLALYKSYPGSHKAADALLQLSKTLAAMKRKEASCSTLLRLRKEYPKAWPRLAADAGRLSIQAGC